MQLFWGQNLWKSNDLFEIPIVVFFDSIIFCEDKRRVLPNAVVLGSPDRETRFNPRAVN